jgi:hypothetical protein
LQQTSDSTAASVTRYVMQDWPKMEQRQEQARWGYKEEDRS